MLILKAWRRYATKTLFNHTSVPLYFPFAVAVLHHIFQKEKIMYLVKFYGIRCRAIISDDTFELIGKNRFTRWLLRSYVWIIIRFVDIVSRICSFFAIEHTSGFQLEILKKLEDGE